MSFCDALENEILDAVFGREALTLNTDPLYVGLSTTTPNDAGANFTEPSGNAYERVEVDNDSSMFPAASGGAKVNGEDITFPTASGSWGTITHFGFFIADTGGTPIATGALTSSKAPGSGDTLKFLAGDLHISLD